MSVYLVDYENVYIEGLQGMECLTPSDKLHIFYTQNRCGLTFQLYEQLIACQAEVKLNEVAVSLKNNDPVKNALDMQLIMYAGYLIGLEKTDTIYIVSKDKDFQLGTEFYEKFLYNENITLKIIPDILSAFQPEPALEKIPDISNQEEKKFILDTAENMMEETMISAVKSAIATIDNPAPSANATIPVLSLDNSSPLFTVQYHNTVRNLLGKSSDEETVNRLCEIISVSDTLVDFNNALARYYHDGQSAKQVYHKFKPRFQDLRHLSRAGRKTP